MNLYAGLKEWLKTPAGMACTVICTISGILLGIQAGATFAQPVTPTYHADFSQAHWIRATSQGATGYFRKKFYVTERVIQAWVSFAATDYYEVAINGTPLIIPQAGGKVYPLMTGSFIAGDQETQFDLTPYLLPGENCITVYVRARMLDREPDLLVKGLVQEASHDQWIYSDASWKAKPVPDDVIGQNMWSKPYLPDDAWPNAQIVSRAVPGTHVLPMTISPAIFENPVQGHWISAQDPSERQIYFRRDFYPSWQTRETWLELSTTGDFEVYLNNRLVTNSELLSEFQGNGTGTLQGPSQLYTVNPAVLINLGPWLCWGKNRLEIRAENSMEGNALLAEILSVQSNGSVRSLSTDASWLSHGPNAASNWSPSRELAPYGSPPYGQVMKLSYPAPMASQEISREGFNVLMLEILLLVIWWLAWIIFSRTLADRLDIPLGKALTLDALAQVPVILALTLLWVLSYDIRFRPELLYQPVLFWLVVAGSILLRWGLWSWGAPQTLPSRPDRFVASRQFVRSYGFGIALAAIVVLAFVLRVGGLMNFSLDQDEVFIRNVTHGIVERGFPSISYKGLLYRLTTYELVPWPEVVCAVLTGWQDWSLRVPSLIFGTLLTGFIGVFGSRWFDRRTGLLAALVYACLSWNIHWARHCFHLQQAQLIAFLSFYAFYMAIRNGGGVDRKYFPLACILFCCTYLTWEGSGFILPAFFVTLVAMHPRDWSWLRQFHFWTGLCFVAAVILIQLCDRAITLPPYLGLGSGLSDISSPSLCFLDPNSNTLFYLSHLLLSEAHALLVVLAFLGLFLCWNHKPTRYILVLFFSLLACYSALLPIYSIRYCYFYQTLLVLGGCAVAIRFYDHIVALAKSVNGPWIGHWARWSAATFILVIFMASSETGLKIYRLTYNVQNPDFFSRQNDGYIDYKNPADYVSAHFRPGDTVIGVLPHTFMHFSGKFSYGLNPLLLKRMYYVRNMNPPCYIDRYSGTMSLRNIFEVQDAFWNNHRVWIMASPVLALDEGSDRPTRTFLESSGRLVYEDSASRIYLWDGGGNPTSIASSQPSIIPGNYGATLNQRTPSSGSSTVGAGATGSQINGRSPFFANPGSIGSARPSSPQMARIPSTPVTPPPSPAIANRTSTSRQNATPASQMMTGSSASSYSGGGTGPATTSNPSRSTSVGVNSNSYSTSSSGSIAGPQPTTPPEATASGYRNIVPGP
jgi:hypothetical protein